MAENLVPPGATLEQVMRTSLKLLVDGILDTLQRDPHSWSTRPCQTCSIISGLAGRSFGCVLYAEQREKREREKVKEGT